MHPGRNAPPKAGWAKMVTELRVNDLNASLAFWNGIIGFDIAYNRQEEKFVYLEHPEGQQFMLCQRHGRISDRPYAVATWARNDVSDLLPEYRLVLSNLIDQNWPIYLGPREVWKRTGDRELVSATSSSKTLTVIC